jgi:hypothetical protein
MHSLPHSSTRLRPYTQTRDALRGRHTRISHKLPVCLYTRLLIYLHVQHHHCQVSVYAACDVCRLVFLVITLVIACRMVVPAFSISFFDRPDVTQTFSAGWMAHDSSFGVPTFLSDGSVLSLVMRTPLFNDC